MAVQVDVWVGVCGPGTPCLADGCDEAAQLWIRSEASPETHYCPPHLVRRFWLYQQQNRGVEVSKEAKAILDETDV